MSNEHYDVISRLRHEKRADQVDGQDLLQILQRIIHECRFLLDTGVVDHNVDPAECLNGAIYQTLHLVGF